MTYRVLPCIDPVGEKLVWSLKPVRRQLAFASSVAFTSSVWVIVTQIDKLLLSGILSLSDYGNYSLAVLIASGITMAVGPIAASITPHLAKLEAQGKTAELVAIYRHATKLVSVLGGAAGVVLIFFTAPVLKAWTGSHIAIDNVVPIVIWYSLGNMMLNFSSFAYSLQYAKGTMRYHVIGNVLMLVLLVPTLFLLTREFGTFGAGLTWGVINMAYLLGWVSFTHARLIPKLNLKWIFFDILIIVVPVAAVAAVIAKLVNPMASRLENIAVCGLSGLLLIGVGYVFNKLSLRLESAFVGNDAVQAAPGNA
jgi:O-antigen/teichoic acid export membrane protein